jgi:pimeloyl-ACP methyl ester carboxylesterase
MPQIKIPSGLELAYETHGDPSDPALLLICGYGAQLLSWEAGFRAELAARGRYVVTYDNRDNGLSERLDGTPANLNEVMAALAEEDYAKARELAPYSLSEMAADGVGLLDALGIERAHIIGASMGGMIAQTFAIEHPERTLTLTSIMSSTGEPEYGQSTPETLAALFAEPAPGRDGYIESSQNWLTWHSNKYPEAEQAREYAAACWDRGHYDTVDRKAGDNRQLAAMISGGSRDKQLRELQTPTLVIHGLDDTLITPSGGKRTAELVPNAKLLLIEDMGHDRPRPLWPQLVDAIIEHTS